MGWVVKAWHTEALATLLREDPREVVADAERDARRVTRAAAREVEDARAYLTALEQFGDATLAQVREHRSRIHSGATSVRTLDPEPAPKPRRQRASMHDSPLTELFRTTTAR
jgi:hypothetical protein